MKIIEREECLLCEGKLSSFYTFDRFPIYMGTTEHPEEFDKFHDMVFAKCIDCGLVQLKDLIPLEILYAKGHAAVIGDTWSRHHLEFCKFIGKYVKGNVVEIGGANLMVAKLLAQEEFVDKITVYDNNIFQYQNGKKNFDKICLKEEFFNPKKVNGKIDTIIHTHLIEHLYDPTKQILEMSEILPEGGYMMFAMPIIDKMLNDNFTNAMNFEHTYLLTLDVMRKLMSSSGFEIIEIKNFSSHAAFVVAQKTQNSIPEYQLINESHHEIFNNFCKHHLEEVERIKKLIDTERERTFIFGAHIFTQYLLGFGLPEALFSKVLDNDPAKQNSRLYGTSLGVASPRILKGLDSPLVVLKAAMYTEEIKKDILENINPNTRFIL